MKSCRSLPSTAKHAQVEKRQEDMAKRIIDTQKKLESFAKNLEELSIEKCKITTELAHRAADLRVLEAAGCNPVQAMEVEQAPPHNLTEDQKKCWIDKQSQANEAKRALQELATHSITKRRCTSKTQQPEQIDVEHPDPIQCPSQEPQVGKMEPPDIKNLIAHADRTAGLANEAASRAFREEAT